MLSPSLTPEITKSLGKLSNVCVPSVPDQLPLNTLRHIPQIFLLLSGWLCCGLNGWCICISPLMTARQLEAAKASRAPRLRRERRPHKDSLSSGGATNVCLTNSFKSVGAKNSQNQLPLLSEIQSREAGGVRGGEGGGGRRRLDDFLFLDT